MLRRLWNHPWTFWALLALPSIAILLGGPPAEGQEGPIHPTGDYAARYLVLALTLTPMRQLMPRARWVAWLLRRRRHIGVAAAGYAMLHVLLYLAQAEDTGALLRDATTIAIGTGWLAFLILAALALASNDASVRRLGRRWKPLQRLAYVAAVLTLVHWVFVMRQLSDALLLFAPLALLQGVRLLRVLAARPARLAG